VYSTIAKKILAPTLDLLRGTKTVKCLRKLEKSQWWPQDRILDLQSDRLRKLIKYVYDNVPYYYRIFRERKLKPNDIQTSKDLAKLPILTKQIIRENFGDLIARGFSTKEIIPYSTGGSTGEPLRFYRTKEDFYNWGSAAELRAYGWTGYEIGDRCALLWERYPYKSMIEKFTQTSRQFLQRITLFNALDMSAEKLCFFLEKMENLQPKFIRGYPTAIYLLARFIEKKGKHNIRPKAIITTGEQLYGYQRDLISKVFKCKTYSHYGSHEVHAIASECPEHSGYHISAENVIVEIINDEGELVPAGEEGKVLVTNLHNYVMPFIRYEIGDIGTISDKVCPCGRGLPILTTLSGRTTDIIFTKSGKRILGVFLPFRFFSSLNIEQFQIVQETYEKLIIKLVLEKECPYDKNKIIKEIKCVYEPILGEDMDIVIEFINQIPPTRAGKRRIVKSNVRTL
jgi:phenylacetate-CoA ligase